MVVVIQLIKDKEQVGLVQLNADQESFGAGSDSLVSINILMEFLI